jgi:hypothetical protein
MRVAPPLYARRVPLGLLEIHTGGTQALILSLLDRLRRRALGLTHSLALVKHAKPPSIDVAQRALALDEGLECPYFPSSAKMRWTSCFCLRRSAQISPRRASI